VTNSSGIAADSTTIDASGIHALWQTQVGTVATSDAVYATLHEAILSGLLPPGARLGEEELGALLGVSRTPIREALFRLETEHLAVRIQRRGLEVRRITPQEIREVYEVRHSLSTLAMQLAAPRLTSADIARLRWINDQLREAYDSGDARASIALGDEFHNLLFNASGNTVLLQILEQLRVRIRRFPGFTYQQPGRSDEIIREHNEIIAALAAGDHALAVELTSAHHLHAMQARLQMLDLVADASGVSNPG
jgi:DNA-binding GntR family transcriptional regulator